MTRSYFIILFALLYFSNFAQLQLPDVLTIKTLDYKSAAKTTMSYDFATKEKKAFLFYDIRAESVSAGAVQPRFGAANGKREQGSVPRGVQKKNKRKEWGTSDAARESYRRIGVRFDWCEPAVRYCSA